MLDNAGGNKCERNPQSSTEISELAWDVTVQGVWKPRWSRTSRVRLRGSALAIRRGEAAERC